MTDNDDPEVIAMRERAERVMARRAKERADARPAGEEAAPAPEKKGRRWYNWVIDGALLGMASYMIYTRFIEKKPEPAPPAPSTAVSASASAHASVTTRAQTELRETPAPSSTSMETLAEKTSVEVLELSAAGYLKVKTPSGKIGWVAADTVATHP